MGLSALKKKITFIKVKNIMYNSLGMTNIYNYMYSYLYVYIYIFI